MTERRFARRQAGLSLIELMIAMLLGLLVAAGIVTVFTSTSSSNRAQNQLARLQEEGRFAVNRITDDLSLANGQYCSNSGGNARLATGGQYLDGLRSATVYAAGNSLMTAFADVTTTWGTTSGSSAYPSQPTSQYSLPAFLAMRGYDCTATACTSIDPNTIVAKIPPAGTALGGRTRSGEPPHPRRKCRAVPSLSRSGEPPGCLRFLTVRCLTPTARGLDGTPPAPP